MQIVRTAARRRARTPLSPHRPGRPVDRVTTRALGLVLLVALALGCASADPPSAEPSSAIGVSLDADAGTAAGLDGMPVDDDPEGRARAERLMREASESLLRAARFLTAQPRFRVVADIVYDVVQADGRPIEFGGRREITIRRPDRLHMKVSRRDGETRTITFDGERISIDLGEHRAYVQMEHPGTLYAVLDHLAEDLGAPVALGTLFSDRLVSRLEEQIYAGYYVETVAIDGRRCEHLSFRLPEVDIQFWIEEGERPLIARIAISYTHADGRPQFRATLRDWDLSPETPDALFRFEPPEESERLPVESIFDEQPRETSR